MKITLNRPKPEQFLSSFLWNAKYLCFPYDKKGAKSKK